MSNGGSSRIYEFALSPSLSSSHPQNGQKRGNFFARTKNRHNCQDFEKKGRSAPSPLFMGFQTWSERLILRDKMKNCTVRFGNCFVLYHAALYHAAEAS